MKNTSDIIAVFCTFPDEEKALQTAEKLVAEKLVACVNIIHGIKSIYSWQGKICKDAEYLMILKSRKNLLDRIEQVIKKHHPYEVPEIIAFDIISSHEPYLNWVLNETVKC